MMTLRAPFAPFAPFKIAVMVACARLSEGILIQVRGGSNAAPGGPSRGITLPVTVDPVAVRDGECSFDPVSFYYCLCESCIEKEIAKFLYVVVEPKDEGIRVKITAQSDGGDLDGVPWTEDIVMSCPGLTTTAATTAATTIPTTTANPPVTTATTTTTVTPCPTVLSSCVPTSEWYNDVDGTTCGGVDRRDYGNRCTGAKSGCTCTDRADPTCNSETRGQDACPTIPTTTTTVTDFTTVAMCTNPPIVVCREIEDYDCFVDRSACFEICNSVADCGVSCCMHETKDHCAYTGGACGCTTSCKTRCIQSHVVTDRHCVMNDWSMWSPCSAPCGPGTRTRSRTVKTECAGNNANVCPSSTETEACEGKSCSTTATINTITTTTTIPNWLRVNCVSWQRTTFHVPPAIQEYLLPAPLRAVDCSCILHLARRDIFIDVRVIHRCGRRRRRCWWVCCWQ